MPFVKALAEVTIRTTLGHTILVPPNTATYVPPEVLKLTPAYGCIECNEAGELLLQSRPKAPRQPVTSVPQLTFTERENPKLRDEAVRMGIAKLYTDQNPDDFTVANNHPKVKAVERVVGFPVSGTEMAAALERYQAEA